MIEALQSLYYLADLNTAKVRYSEFGAKFQKVFSSPPENLQSETAALFCKCVIINGNAIVEPRR
jgi:hypothetical protein